MKNLQTKRQTVIISKRLSSLICASLLFISCGEQGQAPEQKMELPSQPESKQEFPIEKTQNKLTIPNTEVEAWNLLGRGKTQTLGGSLVTDGVSSGVEGSCITGDMPTARIVEANQSGEIIPDGQDVHSEFIEVKSQHDIRKAFNIGLDSNGFYNGVNFDAAVSLSQKVQSSENIRSLLYSVVVKNAEVKMQNYRLKEEARALLQRDKNAFYRRCGKEAIIGYRTGGEAKAVIRISSSEKISESDLNSMLQISGFGFGAGMKSASSARELFSKYKLEIYQSLKGGNSTELSNTIDGIINLYKKWPEKVAKNPVVYEYLTVPYSKFAEELLTGNEAMIEDRKDLYSRYYDKFKVYNEQAAEILQNNALPQTVDAEIGVTAKTKQLFDASAEAIQSKIEVRINKDRRLRSKMGLAMASFTNNLNKLKNGINFASLTNIAATVQFRQELQENVDKSKKVMKSIYYALGTCEKTHLSAEYERSCLDGDLTIENLGQWSNQEDLSDNIERDINDFGMSNVKMVKRKSSFPIKWQEPKIVNVRKPSKSCPGYIAPASYNKAVTVCGAGQPSSLRCKAGFKLTNVKGRRTGDKCWKGGTVWQNERKWEGKCVRQEVIKSCNIPTVQMKSQSAQIKFEHEYLMQIVN